MGKDVNQFIGTGRLGADPESRKVRDGDGLVTNIRIACDNSYKDRDGKERGSTEWIPVVLFGHAADFADKYLKKGNPVTVRGQFKTRKWQDKDGHDRYTTEIVVDNFNGEIISTGSGDGGGSRNDRDDRDRDRDRGRDRDDRRDTRGGRDDDRRDTRGRDDDRGRRDDRDRDDRGSRDRDRDRDDDRRGSSRGRDDDRRKDMDDDIPF